MPGVLRNLLTKTHTLRLDDLEDHDRAFLEQLRAEAETIADRSKASQDLQAAYEDIIHRAREHEQSLTKADLYALDRLLVAMASFDELRAEAPGLYRRYCEERGEPMDSNDPAIKCLSTDPNNGVSEAGLRARVLQLLRSLHWSYTFGPLREKKRVRLIEECMAMMIAATLVLALSLIFLADSPFFSMLATVVYAGIMGGAVSCTQRLSDIPTRGDALGSIYALKNSRYVLYFAPLTGAVFAVVTMLLFMGKVLAGTVFPEFTALTPKDPAAEWLFTKWLVPSNSQGLALLFLWCFIAGFAERFVPDTISDLVRRAKTKKKAESSAVAAQS